MEGGFNMSTLTSITTNKAREKMVKARAGAITLPAITQMAFGKGGVDERGQVKQPLASQNTLVEELLRKNIASHTFPTSTTCRYVCRLEKSELINEDISEVALIDAEGDLVAIKNFKVKGKDEGIEMTFELDDEF